jgi:type II secretory pathway component GspD/PulD (secretin)
MTPTRLTLGSLCLLTLLSATLSAQTEAPKNTSFKGINCGNLPTRTEKTDCTVANYQTRIVSLSNVTQLNDANDILTAARNMVDPGDKIYLVASQNAIVLGSYPEEIARAEALIHELDKPHKAFRLTYTVAVVEDGKTIGTQHFSLVAADGQRTTLKEGDKVPVATGSFSTDNAASQTQFTYLDVGMNFDATVTSLASGLSLKTKVEQSSIGPTNTIAGVAEPVVRQSVLETVTLAPLGKPLMLGSIDIPNSTRRLDVDVLIEPIK